jgi:hypothetical protein
MIPARKINRRRALRAGLELRENPFREFDTNPFWKKAACGSSLRAARSAELQS